VATRKTTAVDGSLLLKQTLNNGTSQRVNWIHLAQDRVQ